MLRQAFVAASLSGFGLASALAADLTITIGGARSANGSLGLAVFNSESAFPRVPQAFASVRIRAGQGDVVFTFHGLAPGKYAVSSYHDENDNGKLDTDALGFPTEGFGFSNEARGTTGPPAFAKAAFDLGDQNKSVTIKLVY